MLQLLARIYSSWCLSEKESLSDHVMIEFEFCLSTVQRDTSRAPFVIFNTKKANWCRFRKICFSRMTHIFETLKGSTNSSSLNTVIEELGSVIYQAGLYSTPIKKTSKHKVPWWSIEIECARKRINASRRRFQRCKNLVVRELYRNNYLEYRNDYNQMLINAKSESWKKFLLTIDAQNVWKKIYTYGVKKDFMKKIEITGVKLPTGETTTSLDETMNVVLQKSFPSDSEENDNNFQKEYRHATRTAYTSFFDPSFSYNDINLMVSMLNLNKPPEWPKCNWVRLLQSAALKGVALKDQCLYLIFWNIIINDLLFKLNNLVCCEIIAFSDDILVCSQGKDLPATFLHAQEALNLVSDWSKGFNLDFNPDKTRIMAFGKQNVCYDAFHLYLNGTLLPMGKSLCFFHSNYDCILPPFFLPHPSERNVISIIQLSDKRTEDFPVICYNDCSKIDGRVGFAFVVFRSGAESENFQLRIHDECTIFVAELLCLNFAVKWIPEQNSVISEYLICTDSFRLGFSYVYFFI
ncbi:hypothetical protein TNCV_1787451 [Trichonephila clavipes]|nr:hypothetical protein TNCV_1787451 [Trichonephila clavipes]